ncbi:MAG: YncE family protein [Acidobacteriota bacterium]
MKRFAALASVLLMAGCATNSSTSTATNQSPATAAAAPARYHVVRHIPVGGVGGWDYLTMDGGSHRLFLSHSDRVEVVDVGSGKVVGTIPNTPGVHGIAIASSLHRGFVSAGRTSSVTIFDLDSLVPLGEVKTGERPDAIIFDPVTARVFTFNAGGKNTTAIEAASGAVAGTIDLGGKPEFAVSDGKGRVYVNIEDTNEVVAFDPKALTVITRWKLEGCDEPSGLAMDRAHGRLFSGCGNKVMAISDADAGRMLTTVPIGEGVDANVFDPALGLAFSSNGADGTLTVVRETWPSRFEVIDTVATQRGARTMALDEKTHHVYLATAQFGPPPAPTAERPHPRPSILPDSFEVVEVAP